MYLVIIDENRARRRCHGFRTTTALALTALIDFLHRAPKRERKVELPALLRPLYTHFYNNRLAPFVHARAQNAKFRTCMCVYVDVLKGHS